MAGDIQVVRLEGECTLGQAVDDIDACLRRARQDGVRRLLIDIRGLSGFGKPDVGARMGMIRRWAASAGGAMKVAMVSPRELNDGERFDIVLARALAFDGDVFEDEDEARHWLEQTPALWAGPPPVF